MPRAPSASSRARSAAVRTNSSTGQTAKQTLCGREIKTPERVKHVTGIDAGICRGDGVRLAPQRFTAQYPGTLGLWQLLDLRIASAHER